MYRTSIDVNVPTFASRCSSEQECVMEDPNVVDEVDSMMSTMGIGQISDKATSAFSSAKAWLTGKKRPDFVI